MTDFQWKVVMALVKIVLRMLEVGTANTIRPKEVSILQEALERDNQ